jgi:pectate lyase
MVPDAAGDVARDAGYLPSCSAWPAATATEMVSATIRVSGTFDGGFKRFVGTGPLGSGTQDENLPPMFQLAPGSVLKNVIIGAPAADGVHCSGTCLLQNVWWEDVGEDAATLEGGSATQVMTVDCGGAKKATDKVFQHNGAGTMIIHNFFADTFGKLYRSCGNCSGQYTRHAELDMITATGGGALAGVNENYMDTARFTNIYVGSGITICERWEANNTGAEPRVTGSGADGKFCIYQPSDIHRI